MTDKTKYVFIFESVFSFPGQIKYIGANLGETLKLSQAIMFKTFSSAAIARKNAGLEGACNIISITTKELFQARLKGI